MLAMLKMADHNYRQTPMNISENLRYQATMASTLEACLYSDSYAGLWPEPCREYEIIVFYK